MLDCLTSFSAVEQAGAAGVYIEETVPNTKGPELNYTNITVILLFSSPPLAKYGSHDKSLCEHKDCLVLGISCEDGKIQVYGHRNIRDDGKSRFMNHACSLSTGSIKWLFPSWGGVCQTIYTLYCSIALELALLRAT